MSLINYQGDSKIIKRICQLLKVTDVQDGEGHSLVDSNGIAVVTGGGGGSSTLSGLSDVDTSGVSSGDVLAYNGTSQKWEDKGLASVATSGSYNDLSNTPTIPAAQVNSDWNASSGVAQILNKPTIPDELADLSDDSTHRLVTDTEKTAWSAKVDDNPTFSEASTRANIDSGDSFATILGKIKKFFTDLKTVAFTGSYSDLSNQPTIPSVSANPSTTTATLSGIEIDGTAYAVQSGSANVQSDWNQTDTTADDYIKNKPSLATVATSGSYNDLSNKPTIPTIPTNVSYFTNDSGYQNSNGQVASLKYTGTANGCFTVHQTSGSFMGRSNWASYLIANHGDGATYYSQTIALPFWGPPIYRRLEGGVDKGWKNFVTEENIADYATRTSVHQGSEVTVQVVSSGNSYAYTVNANNNKVGQTNSASNNADYRVLYSVTADDTNRIEDARKGAIYFNPSTRRLFFANGVGTYGNVSKALVFQDGSDTNHALQYAAYNNDANYWGLWPNRDGWLSLGNSWRRWGQIYSTSASISTSDRNEKKDISPLDDKAKDFIMALNPVSYKFIDGKTGRTHYGMIAQDVEEEMSSLGMTDMDFAGFCKDQKMEENYIENEDGTKTPDFKYIDEYRYGLRYEEFIAPLIKTVQIQQEEIEMLKKRLEALEGEK